MLARVDRAHVKRKEQVMPARERRRMCPNCQVAYLRFVGKQDRDDGLTEFLYECPNPDCRARWAIGHANNPQGKRTAVQSIRRLG